MKIILIQGPPGSNKRAVHNEIVSFLEKKCKKQVASLHMGEQLKDIAFKKSHPSAGFINETIQNGALVSIETVVPIWKQFLQELHPTVDHVVITGALRFVPEVDKFLLFISEMDREMDRVSKVFRFVIDLPIQTCIKNIEKTINDADMNGSKQSYINNKIAMHQKTTVEAIHYFSNHGKKYPFVFSKKINVFENNLILFDIVTGLSDKKKRITIAGDNCSGKSTISQLIGNRLTMATVSSGDYARSIANGSGVSVEKACATAMEEKPAVKNFDERIDDWVREFNSQENFVMDSRLAFHLISTSFKVRLELDSKTASEWVWENPERREKEQDQSKISTREEFQNLIEKRLENDIQRYWTRNGVDIRDRKHYDLIINVKNYKNQRDKIAELVLEGYYKWLVG